MTHKQIWLQSAEAFLTPLSQRTECQLKLTEFGLCRIVYTSIDYLYDEYVLFEQYATKSFRSEVYWLPVRDSSNHKKKHDELRGLLSLFFAVMTLKEFKQLLIEPEK